MESGAGSALNARKVKEKAMKRIRVFGKAEITVSVVIEAEDNISEAEIYNSAVKEFGGIHSYVGNGGMDKLIGVSGSAETIAADEFPTFDDYMEELSENEGCND